MITGVHAMFYSKDADKLRAFFRDVLGFPYVDAGHGWLIFALPPSEAGVHPAEESGQRELSLMCDDIEATVAELAAKGVVFRQPVKDQGWGLVTEMELPGGGTIAVYQPKNPVASLA